MLFKNNNKLLHNLSSLRIQLAKSIQTKSVNDIINDIKGINLDEPLRVVGWVKSYRDHKKLKFLTLKDGDHQQLQLVITDNILKMYQPDIEETYSRISMNASIEATGHLVKPENEKQPNHELHVTSLKVINSCDPNEYPFKAKSKPTLETIRNNIHLRSHTDEFSKIMQFRSQLVFSFHEYFMKNRFVQIQTPVLTANNCEGGCETFQVVTNDQLASMIAPRKKKSKSEEEKNHFFFSNPAFLTASAQLHLETMTTRLAKVYTLSPTFRAEKSDTRHHLAEFYMLEAELIDMENLDQLLDFTEDLIRKVAINVYERVGTDFLSTFKAAKQANGSDLVHSSFIMDAIRQKFKRVKYSEAVDILNRISKSKLGRHLTKKSIEFGEDLNKEQEKLLVEYFENVPVFVTHYPKDLKPFYMRQNLDAPDLVDNFDLLAPGVGEIVGGSLREHRLYLLEKAMQKQSLDLKSYEAYLQTKRFGAMKMGGFGLGLERFIQFLINIENIRDTCAFPRALYHCKM